MGMGNEMNEQITPADAKKISDSGQTLPPSTAQDAARKMSNKDMNSSADADKFKALNKYFFGQDVTKEPVQAYGSRTIDPPKRMSEIDIKPPTTPVVNNIPAQPQAIAPKLPDNDTLTRQSVNQALQHNGVVASKTPNQPVQSAISKPGINWSDILNNVPLDQIAALIRPGDDAQIKGKGLLAFAGRDYQTQQEQAGQRKIDVLANLLQYKGEAKTDVDKAMALLPNDLQKIVTTYREQAKGNIEVFLGTLEGEIKKLEAEKNFEAAKAIRVYKESVMQQAFIAAAGTSTPMGSSPAGAVAADAMLGKNNQPNKVQSADSTKGSAPIDQAVVNEKQWAYMPPK